LDLGVDEMFQSEGVCLIEWADRVTPVLPADRLQVEIEVVGATARNFLITALGPRSADLQEKARGSFEPLTQSDT
jgi:tRNA threonylcarbamoyladenosine biosynthesis protein TsaE